MHSVKRSDKKQDIMKLCPSATYTEQRLSIHLKSPFCC